MATRARQPDRPAATDPDRPASTESDAVVEHVARLFFEHQLTKVDIAARLGMSRFRVARLLDRALADGIVRIEFRGAPAQDRDLGAAVATRFGIGRCVVASSEDPKALGRLGAEVVDGVLEPGEAIGIAWGTTMARVVAGMPSRADPSIEVVQLAGSSAIFDTAADPGDLTRVLAERLGGAARRIHAPAFVDSPTVRDALARQPEVASTIARFDDLQIALVGIGAFGTADHATRSSLVRSGALPVPDLKRLGQLGAVGDLLVHPFTADGRFVAPDLAERAIAISIDQLRRVPSVIAVAAGPAKVEAIAGALSTGVIGVLVTDAATARRLAA